MWRGLRSRPELFAQYLSCFKKSTYRKVMKEAVSPDLLSCMFAALRDHASAQSQLKALQGLSQAPNFSLTHSLLPEQDLQCVRQMFASSLLPYVQQRLARDKGGEEAKTALSQSFTELCSAYGFQK